MLADPEGTADLLRRLADPDRTVGRRALPSLAAEVGAAVVRWDLPAPDRVRAVSAGAVVVAPAADAVVVDRPDLLPLRGTRPVVPATSATAALVAEAYDVQLLSSLVELPSAGSGVASDWPEGLLVLPGTRLRRVPRLAAVDADGRSCPVPWLALDGVDLVDDTAGMDVLARVVAHRAGDWSGRYAVAARLSAAGDPALLAALDAEDDLAEEPVRRS